MSQANSAAWLDGKDSTIRVGPATYHKPAKGQVLIETRAVAINPVDWAQHTMGMFIQEYPYAFGCDLAGRVVEVGDGVTHVSVGSRVLAQMTPFEGTSRAAFQKFAVALGHMVTPIPDEMTYKEACVIPLALITSIAGLYEKDHLALPLPSISPKSTGKTLLIWGGAASVGSIAIQLAVASGLEVITTSSPRNFDACKNLGAAEVYDYNSTTVVEDIKATLKGREFAGVYEASGTNDGQKLSAEILSSLGGGVLATVQMPIEGLPSNVKGLFNNAVVYAAENMEDTRYLWLEFLPAALKNGVIRPAPEVQVAGQGLESIQHAVDTWRKGVSAKKIVVEL